MRHHPGSMKLLAALVVAASSAGCATVELAGADGRGRLERAAAGDDGGAPAAFAIGRVRLACLGSASVWTSGVADPARRSPALEARRECAGAVTRGCYRDLGDRPAPSDDGALLDCVAAGVERCEAEYREACGGAPGPFGASSALAIVPVGPLAP